jgi:hypothetical protein
LLDGAGFDLTRIVPTPSAYCVIEAVRKQDRPTPD